MQKNPRTTAIEIRNTLERVLPNVFVHSETVQSVLRKNDYRNRVPRKSCLLVTATEKIDWNLPKKRIDKPTDFWLYNVYKTVPSATSITRP